MTGRIVHPAIVICIALAVSSSPPAQAAADDVVRLEGRVSHAPADALAHSELGVALASQGDRTRAEHHLWMAVLLDEQLTAAWANLGQLFRQNEQHEQAIAAFGKALSLDPNLTDIWADAGSSLRALERAPESMFAFQTFISRASADHPKRAQLEDLLAQWAEKGTTPVSPTWPTTSPPEALVQQAAEAVARSAKPSLPPHRGDEAFDGQYYVRALRAYEKQSKEEPDDGVLLYKLGATRAILGDPTGALRAWRRVLREAPGRLILNRQIAYATRRMADWGLTQTRPEPKSDMVTGARSALLAGDLGHVLALTRDAKSVEALFLRGEAALRLGSLKIALDAFDRGIALAPSDRGMRGGRIEVLIHQGRASALQAAGEWMDEPETTTAAFLAERALITNRRIRHGVVSTNDASESDEDFE